MSYWQAGGIAGAISSACMVICAILMIRSAWRYDRDRVNKYPPSSMLSIGLPILVSGLLGFVRTSIHYKAIPDIMIEGSLEYIIVRTIGAVLWVNLIYLLLSGRLVPDDWRSRNGDRQW